MSQDFMDPEILSDFIIEAKEHLETIEPNLLELEKAPDNLSLLNEIFRPMHSLKGASGFMGLNRMNRLAHKAENILDELRKGVMAVNSDIMDVILASTDVLRQMIDNLEATNSEGDVDTDDVVARLDAIMAGEALPAPQSGEKKATEPVEAPAPEPAAATDAPEAEQPPAPEEAAPAQAPAPAAGRQSGDVEAWIESRPAIAPYALTAFGEAHLKDFIEEARDNISSLSEGLLELEKHPDDHDEMVNDIFRYFHNLKGNSGIIGYQELNSLTHEAETLLNAVRKGERQVTAPLVDLLLLAVDALEALIFRIDPVSGQATPFDATELLEKLREAIAEGKAALPESLLASAAPVEAAAPGAAGAADDLPAADETEASDAVADAAPVVLQPNIDEEDVQMFRSTIKQQFNHIESAIAGMREDGSNRDYADAMFRSLSTVRNCASFMGLEDIKIYAQRTAGILLSPKYNALTNHKISTFTKS